MELGDLCLGTPAGITKAQTEKCIVMLNYVAFKTYIKIWLAHVGFTFDAPPVNVYAKLYIYGNKSYTVYKNGI